MKDSGAHANHLLINCASLNSGLGSFEDGLLMLTDDANEY